MVSQRTDLKLTRCKRCLRVYFAHDGEVQSPTNECYISEANLKLLKNGKSKKSVPVHLPYSDFGEWQRGKMYTNVPLCGISKSAAGKEMPKMSPIWFVFPCKCRVEPIQAWLDCDYLVLAEGENEGMHYTYSIEEPNKLEQTYDPATEQFTVKCPEMRHRGE